MADVCFWCQVDAAEPEPHKTWCVFVDTEKPAVHYTFDGIPPEAGAVKSVFLRDGEHYVRTESGAVLVVVPKGSLETL